MNIHWKHWENRHIMFFEAVQCKKFARSKEYEQFVSSWEPVSMVLISFGQSIDCTEFFQYCLRTQDEHWSILFMSVDIAIKTRIWCYCSGDLNWENKMGGTIAWGNCSWKPKISSFRKGEKKLVKFLLVRETKSWTIFRVGFLLIPSALCLLESASPRKMRIERLDKQRVWKLERNLE